MADQAVVEKTTHRLAEAELEALRNESRQQMCWAASERVRSFDPAVNGRPEAVLQDEETERLLAAAEVYGPLRNAELAFSDAKGLPAPSEWVDVGFSGRAMAWLRRLRDETRGMLDDERGTIEVSGRTDGTGTPQETFLLWILDGIFGGEDRHGELTPPADATTPNDQKVAS